jgi:DNA-binding protein HU-beta
MNKKEIVRIIADKYKFSLAQSEEVFQTVLEAISEALAKGDKVAFTGFGIFSVKKREARIGRNPKTGVTLKILARKVPHFRAGKELKKAVDKK